MITLIVSGQNNHKPPPYFHLKKIIKCNILILIYKLILNKNSNNFFNAVLEQSQDHHFSLAVSICQNKDTQSIQLKHFLQRHYIFLSSTPLLLYACSLSSIYRVFCSYYYLLYMKVNNIWNVYSSLSPQEWRIYPIKHTLRLINNYSDEEFDLVRIQTSNQMTLESLRNRSIYPIPYTPKMEARTVEAFIQREKRCVDQTLKKIPCDILILQKLKLVIRSVEMLVKKYGYFRITSKMIKITRKQSLVIWIHEHEEIQLRKYPIHPSHQPLPIQLMVIDLFTIFMKDCKLRLLRKVKSSLDGCPIDNFQKSIQLLEKIITDQISANENKLASLKHQLPQFLKKQFRSPKNQQCLKRSESPKPKFMEKQKFAFHLSKVQSLKHFSTTNHYQSVSSTASPNKQRDTLKIPLSAKTPKGKNSQTVPQSNFNSMVLASPNLKSGGENSPYRSMDQMIIKNKDLDELDKQSTKDEKKTFRQSSNSISTTTYIYNSITSSGRTRLLDDEGILHKKNVSTSFGSVKSPKSTAKIDNKFMIKVSKIIEENHYEDGTQNSPESLDNSDLVTRKSEYRMCQSEMQKDFYNLLYHNDMSKQHEKSNMVISGELEQEFNNILG